MVAIEGKKKIGAYIQPETPTVPVKNIPTVYDHQALRSLLGEWVTSAPGAGNVDQIIEKAEQFQNFSTKRGTPTT
jgi:hypothetical protein